MSSINFDNPWLFLIALPLAALILVPFFLSVRKENRNVHNVTSCILHLLMVACITFSAVGTTVKSVIKETNVYVVADLSYSTSENLDLIDECIKDYYDDLPLNTEMGVVCFGGKPVVHTALGKKPKSVRGSVDKVDNTYTDIAAALEYTGRIFKNDVVKRIVLITDAKQSNVTDASELKRVVDSLYASKIYVDAVYIDSNIDGEKTAEVQITSAEVSSRVYQGQDAVANVLVQSSVNTRATLEVKKDGMTISSQPIEISTGLKSEPIPLESDVTGEYRYEISLVDVERDASPFNNVCNFTQTVAAKPKTLFITEQDSMYADESLARGIFGLDYEESIDMRVVGETPIPYTVSDLCAYDEIVLSDVDISKIEQPDMFVESLDTVVSLLGKSLVGMGDLSLQNTTDPTLLKLANMLPVRYGSPLREQKYYTIILDMSNSMNLAGKMTLAKKSAKQLLDLLDDKDYVSVVAFHGNAEIVQTRTSASNRESIKAKIDNLEDEHGTVITGGFNAAKKTLETYAQEMETQVFLISDGAVSPAAADWTTSYEIIKDLKVNSNVVTSVLGVLPNNSNKLKSCATYGGGSFWEIEDDTTLTEDVFVDLATEFGETIVNGNTLVKKALYHDEVLEGIDDVSFLRGYVAGRAKANATTVLTAEHIRPNASPVTVPIYSYWKYGNGKTSAFMSTFTGTWTSKWNDLGVDVEFFRNMFDTNTPTERVDAPFITTVNRQSSGATVQVRPAQLKAGATVSMSLISPNGEKNPLTNVGFDSNVYSSSFELHEIGEYRVEITYEYKGESYTTKKPIFVSYFSEYDSFATYEPSPLYRMLGEKGTVIENPEGQDLEIVNDESEVGVRLVSLTAPLMIAAVALFVVDIIVRKIKWADIKGLFRKVNKGGKRA